jgi:hypothetical protein
MHALLLEIHRFVRERKRTHSRATPSQKAFWHRRYRCLLREGWKANPKRLPAHRSRGRPKQTKAQNLLDRLQLHQDAVLAFLYDFRYPLPTTRRSRICA